MFSHHVIARCKTEIRLGAFCLIGLAFGLAVLQLPSIAAKSSWLMALVGFTLKINALFAFAMVALLSSVGGVLPTRYRDSLLLVAISRVCAKFASGLSLRAAMFILGLSGVVAYSRDWHALSTFLIAAIWFAALRKLVLEHASGAPRPNVTAACTGWIFGVAFQSEISHLGSLAMHII
ncbi:hypothetical protein BLA39750_00870 [Burkholderia lata]|uniref:Uncharacterized protein n=1 Tax=Burkholderia lata (strain ATCC 17760 / DSM 23089 / LMG 22485 / NCIMB 9086 / R18194 / 383) TaxID=482957 RepID=A0A6P2V9N1_BURL3|nr:hypothetical protein [Burkholderia lata]VWC75939.1 hypothetical protein BLA39750_00870 [Burkholderia lata]